MKQYFLLAVIICLHTVTTANNETPKTTASLDAVTVYRQGAEMSHTAKAGLPKGYSELIITGLSNAIEINSVQIKNSDNVTVMGMEFSTDNLKEMIKTPRTKMLEDSLDKLTGEIEKIILNENITTDLLAVLRSNKEIKGTQTGLSVAELIKLMDYYKNKSAELQQELAQLKIKKLKLQGIAQKITLQIEEEEKKNDTSGGSLVLQLNCAVPGKYDFVITYITSNAYWNAFYDLKANSTSNPLKLVYRAKVFQTTGIDWKQVKLALSTSTPTQTGNAPVFKAWFLSYIDPYQKVARSLTSSVQSVNANTMNYIQSYNLNSALAGKASGLALNESVVSQGYGTVKIRGQNSITANNKPLYVVNGVPMAEGSVDNIDETTIKNIQVLKDAAATSIYGSRGTNGVVLITLKDGLDDYISVTDRELDVTFNIDLPYDVPTNGKAQIATLKEYDVPAFYKYYSVPKLDKDAFLLAEVPDWEGLNLLPGEANIIFEGTYIGKSFIDPSSTQDTINFTMGRDKRIVIKKEKLKDFSSTKLIGTNKKQVFTYEITVKNNKKDEISMLLKDQFPISQNKEVEVEVLETSEAMVNDEIGVLTWKLKLAAGEVKKIKVSYSIKYPKEKVLNLN